jgi:hypothetical protein
MRSQRRFTTASIMLAFVTLCVGAGLAGPGQQAILDHYATLAAADDAAFAGFSPTRGEAFFRERHGTGNPEIVSCHVCHTTDPTKEGQTRAGKPIAPMAVSVTPDRYTDLKKVEKWLRRNCQTVIGRECTALEKGDFIAFMSSQ